jgi:hypothetical protein
VTLRIAIIVPFLNEEKYLGTLLDSVARQERPPDQLVLVDDGSNDRSPEMAAAFAREHAYATVLRRPPRPPERDRMMTVPELRAFDWALSRTSDWDVVAKMDADLELSPDLFAEVERRFEANPQLGITGAYVSALDADGRPQRQRCPVYHVEGENTFYRRECLEAIRPLPFIHAWDTIDEVRARMAGWRTESFATPAGDQLHLRRMGSHDGVLRGYRRAGLAAWGYGAHPLQLIATAIVRMREPPPVLCGVHYLAGWAMGPLKRFPRAEPELRRFVRKENLRRLRGLLRGPRRVTRG